jgi:hypothetical protein
VEQHSIVLTNGCHHNASSKTRDGKGELFRFQIDRLNAEYSIDKPRSSGRRIAPPSKGGQPGVISTSTGSMHPMPAARVAAGAALTPMSFPNPSATGHINAALERQHHTQCQLGNVSTVPEPS